MAVAAAVTTLVGAAALVGHPHDPFTREWRHYQALRRRDVTRSMPEALRAEYARVIETKEAGSTDRFLDNLLAASGDMDAFGRGDALLIRGRIRADRSLVCASVGAFVQSLADAPDDVARAVIHETLFAVGRECGTPRPIDLAEAASLWEAMGVAWRADDERQLLAGRTLPTELAALDLPSFAPAPPTTTTVTFGGSTIALTPATRLGAQAERVSRDWLAGKLASPWKRDPGIEYFEGALVNTVTAAAAARPLVLYGTLVRKIGAHWYAPDETGRFRFLVLRDKVEQYPTTRFLAADVAVLIDTHGASALVALALEQHADVVVACCDYFDKIFAAEYLAASGVAVVCPADRFLGYAIGSRAPAPVLGGALFHRDGDRTILGGDPVTMRIDEPVIVEDTDEPYPEQYADTPARYFALLAERSRLTFDVTTSQRRRGLAALLDTARQRTAGIVALRVQSEDDAALLAAWLDEDVARRALLFHSAPFPAGRRILARYPGRVTAPDAQPVFHDTMATAVASGSRGAASDFGE